MDVVGTAAMAMAMQQAQLGQKMDLQMVKQAAQQDAQVTQMVTAATQSVKASNRALDITV